MTGFWRQRFHVEARLRNDPSQRSAATATPRLAKGHHHPRNNTSTKLFTAVRMGFEGPQRARTGTTATDSMAMPYLEPPLPIDIGALVREAEADAEAVRRRRGDEHDLFMPHFEAGSIRRVHRVRRNGAVPCRGAPPVMPPQEVAPAASTPSSAVTSGLALRRYGRASPSREGQATREVGLTPRHGRLEAAREGQRYLGAPGRLARR